MAARSRVEILVAPGCAARRHTEELVAKLLIDTSVRARVSTTVIEDVDQAEATRFLGSPSVRVNGIDVEPEARDRREYGMG
jgi:hypothetical protein